MLAGAGVIAIFTTYGLLLKRLKNRRIGSAAIGSFYDMLNKERQRAAEVVVEEQTEEQSPEGAEAEKTRDSPEPIPLQLTGECLARTVNPCVISQSFPLH